MIDSGPTDDEVRLYFFTTTEVADAARCTPSGVWRAIRDGRLRAVLRPNENGRWRWFVAPADVTAFRECMAKPLGERRMIRRVGLMPHWRHNCSTRRVDAGGGVIHDLDETTGEHWFRCTICNQSTGQLISGCDGFEETRMTDE